MCVQVDNQLFGAVRPVMVYVTPNSRHDVTDGTPALHISTFKVPSAKWNAEIFKVRPDQRPGDSSPRSPPWLESQGFQFDPTFLGSSLVFLPSPIVFSVILFLILAHSPAL